MSRSAIASHGGRGPIGWASAPSRPLRIERRWRRRPPATRPTSARAATALDRRPNERAAEAYRLSLEGWRALERGEVAAAATLAHALNLAPGDAVARYRYGRALAARHDDEGALAEFERALASRASCPPTVIASAHLEAGRVHERAGRRDQAAAMYQHAARVFGSGAELRALAARALARLAPDSPRL
jgi:tetratricopeptide (TPR) repeat protein